MKKAEIGTSTVIMIVIGLLALVVVAFLIIRASQGGKDTLLSCETAGGTCRYDCDPAFESHHVMADAWCVKNEPGTRKCCT